MPGSNPHVDVEELHSNLPARGVRSGMAVLLSQGGVALVGVSAVVILARLLRPFDFGLVAMAFPVVVIALVLRNFGLDVGIIYRHQLDLGLVNSVFWTALVLNFLLTMFLAGFAPLLAWFYHEPRVNGLVLAFCGGLMLLNLGALPETLLKRQMRFHLLAAISFLAALIGATVAVIMAMLGAAYWALALQTIAAFCVRSFLAWMCCHWRPSRPTWLSSHGDLRNMLASGRYLTATRLLNLCASYFDRVIVGWLAGPTILGLYENGRRIAFLALDSLYAPLLDVGVAGFSRASRDGLQYRAFGIRAVQLALALILPGLTFLVFELRPITVLLLGESWLPSVPYARAMIFAALAQSFSRPLMWFYLSTDRTAQQMRWFALQTTVSILAIALGAAVGGVYGIAVAFAIASAALTIPAIVYGLRESPFSAADFARAAGRPILFAAAAAVCLVMVEEVIQSGSLLGQCLLAFAIYFSIYAALWFVSPGSRAIGRQILRLLIRR